MIVIDSMATPFRADVNPVRLYYLYNAGLHEASRGVS